MTIAKPQRPTLIDTISAGYAVLNKRLWIVLIPVVLNLALAFGTQLSVAPLVERSRGVIDGLLASAARDDSTALQQVTMREQFDTLESQFRSSDVRQALLWLNFVPLLTTSVEAQITAIDPPTLVINSGLHLLSAIVVLNAVGLLVSSLFLQQVATAVRVAGGASIAPNAVTAFTQVAHVLLRVVLWALLVFAFAIALGVPFMLITALVTLLLPQAFYVLILIGWIAAFWVRIYIGFAVEAIAVDRVGPLRAILSSASVVRRNFFPSIGLLLISALISLGLGLIWQQLSVNVVGLLVACVASAYIGTGLEAARMVFYRERLRHLKKPV